MMHCFWCGRPMAELSDGTPYCAAGNMPVSPHLASLLARELVSQPAREAPTPEGMTADGFRCARCGGGMHQLDARGLEYQCPRCGFTLTPELTHQILERHPHRGAGASGGGGPMEFAVVSDARDDRPFPYVWVEDDGSARELDADERAYLRTPFHPADGGRPYVKERYRDRTPDGRMRGFLERRKLPRDVAARLTPWPPPAPPSP